MTPKDKGYEILSVDDLDRYAPPSEHGPVLMPLRRRLGFRPFGVNCWTSSTVGGHVIERHYERDGDEELYIVIRGRATFTVGDETVDAQPGTIFHLPPGTLREAIAAEQDTVVLAVGAKPGEVWSPAPWEDFAVAFATLRAGDEAGARALVEDILARHPGTWQGEYNAACFEALTGDAGAAFTHLRRAHGLNREVVAKYADDDEDFASLRSDERWRELFG
jgi:Cupin domain